MRKKSWGALTGPQQIEMGRALMTNSSLDKQDSKIAGIGTERLSASFHFGFLGRLQEPLWAFRLAAMAMCKEHDAICS